ncbi:MAG TPA: hypothetical protein VLJ62_18715 [Burkholderiaceae bacterium]|jgi:hypothetical protein|nr:hypothetical protein [Burkholderiaceae bacterium]
MKKIASIATACALLLCSVTASSKSARANDFPTAERVLYVQECIKNNPGPHFEMINKCSCAVDALAREIKYDDYVTMTTIVNAMSIGGERGNDLRDNETLKPQVKRYRDLHAQAQKTCFITKK